MIIKKVLKNKSGGVLTILNRDVDNNDEYDIPFHQWLKLADNIQEQDYIYTAINNGNIVVNDGFNDLSISEGIKLCRVLDFYDHHSGLDYINDNEDTVVEERKQMTTYGELTLDGDITIDGTLILK